MATDFHILLVEDSKADAKIIERALREAGIDHRLTVINDGRQALDYLTTPPEDCSSSELLPDLILLDLNLPGLNGCEVLRRIKADVELRSIPVVVLTTSNRDEDIAQSYQAGANTYLCKPSEFPEYRELASTLGSYWIGAALRVPRSLVRRV